VTILCVEMQAVEVGGSSTVLVLMVVVVAETAAAVVAVLLTFIGIRCHCLSNWRVPCKN